MRPAQRALFWLACSLAYACGDGSDGSLAGDGSGLSAAETASAEPAAREEVEYNESDESEPESDEELTVDDLECPRGGGSVGKIRVAFDCGEVTVVSCKDLSNVVIELADGSRQRFEGLSGQQGVFHGKSGGQISRVWVKAGANHSGDGPGYGERFDAPAGTCTPPPPPPPADTCLVADGSCEPSVPPPPRREDDCFVADGSCEPWQPPPPPPPPGDEPMVI